MSDFASTSEINQASSLVCLKKLNDLANEYAAIDAESHAAYEILRDAKEAVLKARNRVKRAEIELNKTRDAFFKERDRAREKFPSLEIPELKSGATTR